MFMRVYKTEHYDDMSLRAARIMAAQLLKKPGSVLGLATGSTPVGLYSKLIEWYNEGILDFSQAQSVNLDEYVGLDGSHDQSYRYFMHKNLFERVNILPENTHVPDGKSADPAAEGAHYAALIRALGGIDLQLLGIGRNGHIGFNEPGDAFIPGTHLVNLAQSTVEANARFFEHIDLVPRQAITMGIADIMQAKQVLVTVSGADKADAVYAAFHGPVTPSCPASILQLHPDVILVGDKAALSRLS
jgi:glucosamine-6-phosphate deaminase